MCVCVGGSPCNLHSWESLGAKRRRDKKGTERKEAEKEKNRREEIMRKPIKSGEREVKKLKIYGDDV